MYPISKTKVIMLCMLLISTQLCFTQPSSWASRGVGGGGALFSPSINPSNANEYFVACDMSQLFHTQDFGLNYSQVDFRELQAGHSSKVCFTDVPGLLYSVSYDNDMSLPVKSIDGGANWTPLSGNPDPSEEIFSIFADHNNANRLIIAYYNQIYFSGNGGSSFSLVHTAVNSNNGVTVGGVFFDESNIYIGSRDGVLVSSNGGASFAMAPLTGIPAGQQIWSFAAAKANNITRFYCVTGNTADIYPGLVGSDYDGFAKGVYAIDYGAGNWTSKMTGITLGSDQVMFVAMAENNIDIAYLGGSYALNGAPLIMKTSNGAASWSRVFNGVNNQNVITGWCGQGGDRSWGYAECVFGLAVSPSDANYIIFTDFGFVHKSSNAGTVWQQAYVSTQSQHVSSANTPPNASYKSIGLENTTCWQVFWTDANNMFAAFSDIRGIRSTDAGNSWSFNYTGHTANSMYRIAKHSTSGALFAATSGIHDMYQSTRLADAQLDASDPQGKIIYSMDKGATWQNLHTFSHPVFWISLDPNNPNRAYASVIHYNGGTGIGGVYRCDDLQNLANSTWTLLPNPPRTEKHPAAIEVLKDGKVVCTYSGRRNSSGGFTASSGVFIYDPVNNSWADVSHSGMQYWTKDVVIDPNDQSQYTWYVAVFSGWGGAPNGLGGLYKTTNRGQSWIRINTLDRVTSITFNPLNSKEIYLTTEQDGLWVCNDISVSSPSFLQVNNYDFRQPERVFFNPYNPKEVWVTSFGSGMKMATLTITGVLDFTKEQEPLVEVYPNPVKSLLYIQNYDNQYEELVQIRDLYGKTWIDQMWTLSVDVSKLPKGVYVVHIGALVRQFIKE